MGDAAAKARQQMQQDLEQFACQLTEMEKQVTEACVNGLKKRLAAMLATLDASTAWCVGQINGWEKFEITGTRVTDVLVEHIRASRPPVMGIDRLTHVRAALICAGMSSGPSSVWR